MKRCCASCANKTLIIMPTFIYEAADKKGVIINGEIEADSREGAVEYLRKKNFIPIVIKEKTEAGKGAGGLASISLFERIRPVDRIVFIRNLSATIKAGLNILDAVNILILDTANAAMQKVLSAARADLERGQPLSRAFEENKKDFPAVFVGMLKAGEASGRLEEVLDELEVHLTKEYELARKIKSALAYPILLLIASVGVVVLLMAFVLPRLAQSFAAGGVQLPLITRMVVAASKVITFSPLLDFVALGGLAFFFLYFRKTDIGRKVVGIIISHIPIAKELVKKVSLVRFTRTFSSLIASGTSAVESLALAADAVGNADYREAILATVEKIKTGVSVSESFSDRPDLFPHLLLSMMTVGEKTGTLENILRTFSNFYDQEVDNTLKDFVTFLEPVMLLMMGLIIGAIAISILLPIYQLVGKFV